jgi:hypothetical protein
MLAFVCREETTWWLYGHLLTGTVPFYLFTWSRRYSIRHTLQDQTVCSVPSIINSDSPGASPAPKQKKHTNAVSIRVPAMETAAVTETADDGTWRERAQQMARDLELLREDSRALRRALDGAAADLAFQQECQACVRLGGFPLEHATDDGLPAAGRWWTSWPRCACAACTRSVLALCPRWPPVAQPNARSSS